MELLRGIGFVSDEGGLRGACSHRPRNPIAPGTLTHGYSASQSSCWHPHGGRSPANSNHQWDENAESIFSCPCQSFLLFIHFTALTRAVIITHRPWSAWYTFQLLFTPMRKISTASTAWMIKSFVTSSFPLTKESLRSNQSSIHLLVSWLILLAPVVEPQQENDCRGAKQFVPDRDVPNKRRSPAHGYHQHPCHKMNRYHKNLVFIHSLNNH